jgi:hypothetical protein
MMVRNERNVIVNCVGHLLKLGVNRIYAVDNGSTDDTPELLRRMAKLTGKLELSIDNGAYRQAEVLTALARQAASDGADWILPSDADEFLWLRQGVSLSLLCRRPEIGGYLMHVRNFLQARPVRGDWPGAIASMCVAAIPYGSLDDGFALVRDGHIPFVRSTYPHKLLLRAAPGLQLGSGHHTAKGLAGPLVQLDDGELLHAPIRSFSGLHRRRETGKRIKMAKVAPLPTQSWHLKRLVDMDAGALAHEWRSNTFHPLHPAQAGATRLDWRLVRIALGLTRFRWTVYRSKA